MNPTKITPKTKAMKRTKGRLFGKKNILEELQNKFVFTQEIVGSFNEEEIKKEIDLLLKETRTISDKIKDFKGKIYVKEVELNSLKLEKQELKEICGGLDQKYKNIRTKCHHCGSYLTQEQSLQRIKIDNNRTTISIRLAEIDSEIKKLENDIGELMNKKIGIEKEYDRYLNLTETKSGELTLKQHIEQQAKNGARNIYFGTKNKIILDIDNIEKEIKELNSKIKENKKIQEERKKSIEKDFEIEKLNICGNFGGGIKFDSKFLDFKQIQDSGTWFKSKILRAHLIYSKLLLKYSDVKLPFIFDSIVQDEKSSVNEEDSYQSIENVILKSGEQSFFVLLDKKISHLMGKDEYNRIKLEGKLLTSEKYNELSGEIFDIITRDL
jgi:ribosomal protein S26